MTLDITILNNLILEVVKPGLKEANQMAQGHGMSYYKAKSKPSCPAAWDVVLLGSAGAEVAYMFVPGCMCVRVHMCVYACACAYGMCVTLSLLFCTSLGCYWRRSLKQAITRGP